MHLEVLVEEPSAEAALNALLPKLLGNDATFRIHVHQGKHDLLARLPKKLLAYSKWIPDDYRIVVLLDCDQADCRELKGQLERVAADANICTKTAAVDIRTCRLLNRIAIEELEAWFFGDVPALCAAFPRVPLTLGEKSRFRDPDTIPGGTWEQLEKVLRNAGYFKAGLAKITAARKIAEHMNPTQNRSRSFRVFRDGVTALARSFEG